MRINLNTLARRITLEEGKAQSVSIAQVKEVLRITLDRLAKDYKVADVKRLLKRYRKR